MDLDRHLRRIHDNINCHLNPHAKGCLASEIATKPILYLEPGGALFSIVPIALSSNPLGAASSGSGLPIRYSAIDVFFAGLPRRACPTLVLSFVSICTLKRLLPSGVPVCHAALISAICCESI